MLQVKSLLAHLPREMLSGNVFHDEAVGQTMGLGLNSGHRDTCQPFVSHRRTMDPSGEPNVFLIEPFCLQCELPNNPPDTDFYLLTR